jgi:polyisoprenoid-binding protein YceI
MGEGAAVTYELNAGESRFIVQAFAEGLLSAFGHSPKFNVGDFGGQVRVEDNKLEGASVQLMVKADSLHVIDEVSEKDRQEIESSMRADVLETSRYPEIVFKGTAVAPDRIYEGFYRLKIEGDLTLHGVTRNHSIDALVRLLENGLRAEGESRLRQSDYRIKRVSVAAGTLKVKDEVKLSFNIVARRKDEA